MTSFVIVVKVIDTTDEIEYVNFVDLEILACSKTMKVYL